MNKHANLAKKIDVSALKKYQGIQSSIIPFSSRYYFYLASWDKTPTDFPRFSNVWLITPDNQRILFSDPGNSSSIVCIYHDFDEIMGSSISIEWIDKKHLKVRCKSENDLHKLELDFHVKETIASKILISMAGGPPTPFSVSKPMTRISDFLINRIIAKSGSAIVGITETGQPFYHGDAEKIFMITQGSASYNNKELGMVSKPTWPITFGDAVPFVKPTIKIGTLYIPFEQEMLVDCVT